MSNNQQFDSTFKATITGMKDAFFPKKTDKILTDQDRIDGKTCLVTGASSGLGFAIAGELAKRGGRIILAIRSGIPEKGETIKKMSGNPNISMEFVELSELQSVKDLVLRLKAQNITIDILVCNAGMVTAGSKTAPCGLDMMFTVNYLSTFYFVNLLLEHQIIKPKNNSPKLGWESETKPRLIFVSSESHRVNLPIDYSSFGQPIPYSAAQVVKFYGYYKLILNTFIAELNRRYSNNGADLSVFALCPGAVHSNIARDSPAILKPVLWLVFKLFFQTPLKASAPAVYFACSPKMEGKTDLYLHILQEKRMAEAAYQEADGKRVWEESEKLVKGLV